MKLYQKFLTFSRAKQIRVSVCFVHLLLLLFLLVHHVATSRFRPAKPMVIRTVQMKLQTPPPVAVKPASEKPKPVAAKKPEPPKPAVKNSEKPKKPTVQKVVKKEEIPVKEVIPEKRERAPLALPHVIQPKKAIAPKEGPTYGEFLIAYLQSALILPEFGEVKVKIEMDRFGKVIDCAILETKSFKNAEFLKNQLPDLSFPCLNEFGIVDATHTFTITFRNVENL